MEMNTRLQVEHPVTEMVTGLDLVEWQLRVASGERLPLGQDAIPLHGHAIEARLYAEDADRGFLPSIGRLAHWRMPQERTGVRVDSGFRAGDEVSPHYDPMLAKVIAWGVDRDTARRRLVAALRECEVAGVTTNASFLERVLEHDAFASAKLDTGLIERHGDALFPAPGPVPEFVLVAAAAAEALARREAAAASARASSDAHSPWGALDGWSPVFGARGYVLRFADGEAEHRITVHDGGEGALGLDLPDRTLEVEITREADGSLAIVAGAARSRASVAALGEERHVFTREVRRRLRLVDPLAHAGEEEPHAGHLMAPMSGTIVAVLVKAGERVGKGAPLIVVEAMKMEHTIVAPAEAIVTAVNYHVGDKVAEGADLVDFEDPPD
jgi:3-methylcrotonyl-CoA carboxylase alpha subunit